MITKEQVAEMQAFLDSAEGQRVMAAIDTQPYTHRWTRAKPAEFPVGAPSDPHMVKTPRG